ncbi:flagellar basal body-associated protein FliL [Alkalimonas collagenimarina]|uniref:Flagellar protein FliL n=1 Tax=Alkalimonas collagenimarina TaxID=400390 RepID=A0ABT9H2K1_9GAMM|nr:flagellar basal body-associated protein FliL [Alkalimonas collagenimarina]MDP4537543.1 flagellar basal body-associated protein FliL [Alkalimonas collagenimarina]
MAEDNELKIAEKSGKKKLILMAGGGVALILIAAAVIFFVFFDGSGSSGTSSAGAAGGTTADGGPQTPTGTAFYVPLPRPFIFNVPGSSRDRLVQIRAQLLVRGSNNDTLARRHIPLIEGVLLQTFSSANADDLVTAAGKESLRNKALSDLQQELLQVTGTVVVEEVLFTGFVMQ